MSDPAPPPLPIGFRDVDASNPEKILRCLDGIQALPAGRAYKARALELLGLGSESAVLDVGCGLGHDVARMRRACARAEGVDRSRTLIEAARARHAAGGCEFHVADAGALPLADATFDAVRIDRSLQHMDEPARVVREMARVARPGGVVLCVEPDWRTFLVGGRHTSVTERIEHDWISTFRNPWIGRELSELLGEAGVVERRQEAIWLATRGFVESDLVFEIDASARKLAAELPEALPWLEAYRQGEAYAGVLLMICWGRKA